MIKMLPRRSEAKIICEKIVSFHLISFIIEIKTDVESSLEPLKSDH